MSTAEPGADVDTLPKKEEEEAEAVEEEEDFSGKQEFKWYMKPNNIYELLAKRWWQVSLFTAISYIYSLVMAIYGVDMYCHYSRFFKCGTTTAEIDTEDKIYNGQYTPATPAEYVKWSASMDTYLQVVIFHHILEWLRQWCCLTAIIVGYNWMIHIYYFISIFSIPYGLIATLIGFIAGLTNTCNNHQSQRGTYLKLQGISFFLFIPFTLHPVIIFKMLDKFLHPSDKDKEGNLLWESYLHKLWNEEEEDGGD